MSSADRGPHVPAREVLRFGGGISLRLLIGVVVGLLTLKLVQYGLQPSPPVDSLIRIAYAATFIAFIASFYLRPLAWPEVEFAVSDERVSSDKESPRDTDER